MLASVWAQGLLLPPKINQGNYPPGRMQEQENEVELALCDMQDRRQSKNRLWEEGERDTGENREGK